MRKLPRSVFAHAHPRLTSIRNAPLTNETLHGAANIVIFWFATLKFVQKENASHEHAKCASRRIENTVLKK